MVRIPNSLATPDRSSRPLIFRPMELRATRRLIHWRLPAEKSRSHCGIQPARKISDRLCGLSTNDVTGSFSATTWHWRSRTRRFLSGWVRSRRMQVRMSRSSWWLTRSISRQKTVWYRHLRGRSWLRSSQWSTSKPQRRAGKEYRSQ